MPNLTNYLAISVDVPGKDQLYLEADTVQLMAKKWEIFGWIVSLKKEEIFKIKLLKKKYWLTVTILYIMVKVIIFVIQNVWFFMIYFFIFHAKK